MATTAIIAGGVLAAAGIGFGASAASKKKKALKKIANTPGVDINQVQKDAIEADIADLDRASRLASGISKSIQDQQRDLTEAGFPEFQNIFGKAQEQVASFLRGELPQDVEDQIINRSAARGITSGTVGSQFNRNLTARDLGLTSLNLVQAGLGALPTIGSFAKQFAVPDPVNPGAFFLSASERLATKSKERSERLNLLAKAAGLPGATETIGQGLMSVGGGLLGGGLQGIMGGMGGTPSASGGTGGTGTAGFGGMGF